MLKFLQFELAVPANAGHLSAKLAIPKRKVLLSLGVSLR